MTNTTDLIGPFPVALRLGFSTQTIINWARRGLLPAVFLGKHVKFDPEVIDEFIRAGGAIGPRELRRELNRKPATPLDPQAVVRIERHSGREHASGLPRNDRTRKPSDARLLRHGITPGLRFSLE